MSTDNHSSLRFSLEESVWFQRGQEVAELISISLDPDITIQEDDQYVTIQGSLELSGEYTCAEVEDEEEPVPQVFAREVQSVLEGEEEGQYRFVHRFPVDITIPQNRIESIYDIDIAVESFDYDIPSRNSLKLSAELAITGLYGEQQHGSEAETETETPYWVDEADEVEHESDRPEEVPIIRTSDHEEPQWHDQEEVEIPSFQELRGPLKEEEPEIQEEDESIYEPFKAEAKKEPTASEKQEPEALLMRNTAETEQQESPENEDVINEESERKETPKAPTYEPFEETASIDSDPVSVETEATVETGPVINQKAKRKQVDEEESSSSSSSLEDSPKGKKKLSKKKGLSIAEFLARKEETEVATLRVCIVQQDDTLQQIADRYDVSVQHILNLNHLGLDQNITEGQVLYVPVKYAEKK